MIQRYTREILVEIPTRSPWDDRRLPCGTLANSSAVRPSSAEMVLTDVDAEEAQNETQNEAQKKNKKIGP